MDKRMYSLNLIAYVFTKKEDVRYRVGVDENTKAVYFIFEDNIDDIIKEYHSNIVIQEFIESFKHVKSIIYKERDKM